VGQFSDHLSGYPANRELDRYLELAEIKNRFSQIDKVENRDYLDYWFAFAGNAFAASTAFVETSKCALLERSSRPRS
jgi:hypothetical protein